MGNKNIETIFWDFDGVLMNSNAVRDKGFLEVMEDYPQEQVNKLMEFHHQNGGLSRYVKFRYFFEKVRGEKITDESITKWADKFSKVMLASLIDKSLLIEETINFVNHNFKNYNMHIVSGSDGNELRQICKGIEIDHFFKSIEGSPTPKKELVANILKDEKYDNKACVLIGDSINDYEAAKVNKINFLAYNNLELENKFMNFCPKTFKNI
jgi:phosphoglycolate phosphatase-like HAD superfamily hydrolase